MELNFAFLANSAEVIDGRFFVIGGGIDGLTVPRIPAFVPALAVIASVHFDPDECGHDYQFRTTITLPDGNDMGMQATAQLQARIVPQLPRLGSEPQSLNRSFWFTFTPGWPLPHQFLCG